MVKIIPFPYSTLYSLIQILGGVPWQANFQRILSAKTPRHAKYMTVMAGASCVFLGVPSYVVGIIGASTGEMLFTIYDLHPI